jgi:hypothetical protein
VAERNRSRHLDRIFFCVPWPFVTLRRGRRSLVAFRRARHLWNRYDVRVCDQRSHGTCTVTARTDDPGRTDKLGSAWCMHTFGAFTDRQKNGMGGNTGRLWIEAIAGAGTRPTKLRRPDAGIRQIGKRRAPQSTAPCVESRDVVGFVSGFAHRKGRTKLYRDIRMARWPSDRSSDRQR